MSLDISVSNQRAISHSIPQLFCTTSSTWHLIPVFFCSPASPTVTCSIFSPISSSSPPFFHCKRNSSICCFTFAPDFWSRSRCPNPLSARHLPNLCPTSVRSPPFAVMAARTPAVLRTAASSIRIIQCRPFTERASGPGGLFRSTQSVINPAQERDKQTKSRLRRVRVALDDRSVPDELREVDRKPFETDDDIRDFVESRILESMRTGQFDNLKNKGRPLPEQPSSVWDYVMRIMRQNGIRPHWLQLMHDIDTEKRQVRDDLSYAWHHHMPHTPHRWALAVRVAELKLVNVNRSVDTFNLIRPSCVAHLFRLRLRINEEIQRAMDSDPPQETKLIKPEPKEKKEEPRPSWQLFARFVRAIDVKEYDVPTWGRRRTP